MDEAKNHAVEDAYRRARNSAETLARASGRTLGDLSYASVDTFESRPVMPRMARAMAAVAPNGGALAIFAAGDGPFEPPTEPMASGTAQVLGLEKRIPRMTPGGKLSEARSEAGSCSGSRTASRSR